MQIDADFAGRVFEREPAALASTGLSDEDLVCIHAADPIAVSADPGGRRISQLLGNVIAEYVASVALFVERLGLTDIVAAFASSPEFHAAIRFDRSLPVVFGAYAARRLEAKPDSTLDSILRFERVMVEARRGEREVVSPGEGEIVLAGRARLAELLVGSFDAIGQLSDGSSGELKLGPGTEQLLITTGPAPHPGALHGVDVEVLSASVGEVLRAVEAPLDLAGRATLAANRDVGVEELGEFLRSLQGEGLLEGAV